MRRARRREADADGGRGERPGGEGRFVPAIGRGLEGLDLDPQIPPAVDAWVRLLRAYRTGQTAAMQQAAADYAMSASPMTRPGQAAKAAEAWGGPPARTAA